MRYVPLLARICLSLIFLLSAPAHFGPLIGYAAQHGVPAASLLVPLAGVLALAGGLSVLLGAGARWGALLLIAFLVPVTLVMHDFWNLSDPAQAAMQQVNFLKNLGLLGGALMVFVFGAGPISIDEQIAARRRRGATETRVLTPTTP